MATKTNFLDLVLPELNEFVNSWNGPVNQNMESIDDFCSDLYESLAGSSSTSTWASLRGSLGSLADRLDVSINADGTLDLSGSPDLLAIGTSAYEGQFDSPTDRVDDTDRRIYSANQPVAGSRFAPIPLAGPSQGMAGLDDGIALRSSDRWVSGLVAGGATPFLSTPGGAGKVQLNASLSPAVFNVDGYAFRIREDIVFDFNLLSPTNLYYVWLYVERVEANYNTASFRYGPTPAAKDLRILQSGTTGSTSGSTFQATGSLFNTATLGKVKPGDVLVIDGTNDAAGEYVIDALDGTFPDTKLTIKGTFKADLSGLTWHVQDNWHPNIGAVVTDASSYTQPPTVDGRVYIGRVRYRTALVPDEVVTFAKAGVYDSGWILDPAWLTSKSFAHNLGATPSSVEVWVRQNLTSAVHQPVVRRQVVTDFDTVNTTVEASDPSTATLLFPSLFSYSDELSITLTLFNATTSPAKPTALFTDLSGTDHLATASYVRVVARR